MIETSSSTSKYTNFQIAFYNYSYLIIVIQQYLFLLNLHDISKDSK